MIADRLGFSCQRCGSSSCDGYYHSKLESGLIANGRASLPSAVTLTEFERLLTGWLPLSPVSRLSALLDSDEREAAEAEARLRGLRWLIGAGDERSELNA